MKIYYSEFITPEGQFLKEKEIKNYLIAYQGRDLCKLIDNFNFDFNIPLSIMIDNGAFSVWKSNKKKIDIDAYIAECQKINEKYRDKFKEILFISLDEIPGSFGVKPTEQETVNSAKNTLDNFNKMFDIFGKQTLPVFHQHEAIDNLKYYMQYVSYLCISPANDETNVGRTKWLKEVYHMLKDSNIKTHGLAVTGKLLLETFPFYSADSISWKAPTLYGRLNVWKDFKIELLQREDRADKIYSISDFNKMKSLYLNSDLSYNKKYNELIPYSIQTFDDLEIYITELWKERGIKWNE